MCDQNHQQIFQHDPADSWAVLSPWSLLAALGIHSHRWQQVDTLILIKMNPTLWETTQKFVFTWIPRGFHCVTIKKKNKSEQLTKNKSPIGVPKWRILVQNALHKFLNRNLLENQLEKSLDYAPQEIKGDDTKRFLICEGEVSDDISDFSGRIKTTIGTPVNHHLGIDKPITFDHTNESPGCSGGVVLLKIAPIFRCGTQQILIFYFH